MHGWFRFTDVHMFRFENSRVLLISLTFMLIHVCVVWHGNGLGPGRSHDSPLPLFPYACTRLLSVLLISNQTVLHMCSLMSGDARRTDVKMFSKRCLV